MRIYSFLTQLFPRKRRNFAIFFIILPKNGGDKKEKHEIDNKSKDKNNAEYNDEKNDYSCK